MPIFLDTLGNATIAIAICDRCKNKRPHSVMRNDPNFPGLRVCDQGCADQIDPYRLAARKTERINIRFPRPDLSVAVTEEGLITTGNNQYILSTEGNTQIPTQNGNNNSIIPTPTNNTST
jgi:hypothetical protein